MESRHHIIQGPSGRLHYVTVGEGSPLVLVHGFPQTWHQWRSVIARLKGEYTIVAPDLRGIGATPGPASGYDKQSMAEDLRVVIDAVCGQRPVTLVGHDMGSYVAFAYALRYPELVSALMIIDAPVPGTALYDQLIAHPRAWHVRFHQARDVAEMLITGRERAYIAQFITARIYDCAAISEEDIEIYAAAYSAPGALRAAMEMYRALPEDADFNRAALAAAKLAMPTVFVGGSASLSGELLGESVGGIATNGRAVVVQGAGHWVPEEQPDALVGLIRGMTGGA